MKTYRIHLLSLFFVSWGCSGTENDKKPIDIIKGKAVFTTNRLDDTTFLSNHIGAISRIGDKYAITDLQVDKVYVLKKSLELERVLGSPGRGPGEYLQPVLVTYEKEKLYVGPGDNRIIIYSYSDSVKQWKTEREIPTPSTWGYPREFVIMDTLLYHVNILDKLVEKRDFDGNAINTFGELDIKNISRKPMHLLKNKEFLYLVGISEPVIMQYTYEGKEVNSKKYYDHPLLQGSMKQQERTYKEFPTNTTSILFKDACIIENMLYVLWVNRKSRSESNHNIIIIDLNLFEILKVVVLRDAYPGICPFDDEQKILTYNTLNGNLEVFEMPV